MEQLHKRFTNEQVKELLQKYLKKEIKREYVQQILGIGKTRLFALLKEYNKNNKDFSIDYSRSSGTRLIDPKIENNIIKELKYDKKLIMNPKTPLKRFNYSYIKTCLEDNYNQHVSLNTIIDRAKKNNLYIPKKASKKVHDRQVLTNHIGELLQHDTSIHNWSPYVTNKWYLITTIDDYSRLILHATIISHESSWAHISALESIFLKYGFPLSYYVDSHSIFRYVRGRDEMHYKHHLKTDEAIPQWKQVLDDCNVKVTYALSPQAKGKVERPFAWLQDRLVRTFARNNVTTIKQAQKILNLEVYRYNHRQVHSTTGEIPYLRFQRAMKDKLSLFRSFSIKPPFLSSKDIFCLRLNRTSDSYRKISINNVNLKVNKLDPFVKVNLRIYPISPTYSEIRFWANNTLLDVQKLKNNVFKGVHF